jgi:hypothetical protein
MPLAIVRIITASITLQGEHALTSILSLRERKKSPADSRWPQLLLVGGDPGCILPSRI